MAQVLVLVDQQAGAVAKPTLELLTIARSLGEPVAVVLGSGYCLEQFDVLRQVLISHPGD